MKTKTKKKPVKKPPPVAAHSWTDGGTHVLILRRVDKATRISRNNFVWPKSGVVTCPDWNPQPVCGGGLHGWPWGMGLGEGMDYDIIGDEWIVVSALPSDIVGEIKDEAGNPGQKCKLRTGEVIYSGPLYTVKDGKIILA